MNPIPENAAKGTTTTLTHRSHAHEALALRFNGATSPHEILRYLQKLPPNERILYAREAAKAFSERTSEWADEAILLNDLLDNGRALNLSTKEQETYDEQMQDYQEEAA